MRKLFTTLACIVTTGCILGQMNTADVFANSSELSQFISGYDCSHTTIESGGTMNDANCPVFPPSVAETHSNHGQPIIKGLYDAVHSNNLRVKFNGIWYSLGSSPRLTASGNIWTLDMSTLTPVMIPGDYPVEVEMIDTALLTHSASGTLTVDAIRPPIINETEWVGGNPIIRGTFSALDTAELRININNIWYVAGVDPELTTDGDQWVLNLSNLSPQLTVGTYEIEAQTTTRAGQVLTDLTSEELTILPLTPTNMITHPNNGPLAQTGNSIIMILILASLCMLAGMRTIIRQRGVT